MKQRGLCFGGPVVNYMTCVLCVMYGKVPGIARGPLLTWLAAPAVAGLLVLGSSVSQSMELSYNVDISDHKSI